MSIRVARRLCSCDAAFVLPKIEYVVRENFQELIVCNSGSCRQSYATTKYVAYREGSQSIFYEDPCQNKKCACDAAFVSSKISGILEIVALGFIPALCTEIPCAEIILQRFIYATQVRAHKASHVNEDTQEINIPIKKKRGGQVSKHSMQNVALRGQGAEQTLPIFYSEEAKVHDRVSATT